MKAKLKPCPFCGGEARISPRKDSSGAYLILGCFNEDCQIRDPIVVEKNTLKTAQKAWNRRVEC